ncbi:hypothetical protein BC829DRAFT_404861 [Chytridium lagenaria]|nr:hypothetical protein BC829DRAFT_404861 [Chytridium lagenaria]
MIDLNDRAPLDTATPEPMQSHASPQHDSIASFQKPRSLSTTLNHKTTMSTILSLADSPSTSESSVVAEPRRGSMFTAASQRWVQMASSMFTNNGSKSRARSASFSTRMSISVPTSFDVCRILDLHDLTTRGQNLTNTELNVLESIAPDGSENSMAISANNSSGKISRMRDHSGLSFQASNPTLETNSSMSHLSFTNSISRDRRASSLPFLGIPPLMTAQASPESDHLEAHCIHNRFNQNDRHDSYELEPQDQIFNHITTTSKKKPAPVTEDISDYVTSDKYGLIRPEKLIEAEAFQRLHKSQLSRSNPFRLSTVRRSGSPSGSEHSSGSATPNMTRSTGWILSRKATTRVVPKYTKVEIDGDGRAPLKLGTKIETSSSTVMSQSTPWWAAFERGS